MIELSILICSTHTRRNTFMPRMVERIYSLYEALSEQDQSKVEVLTLIDNKKMMLGHKRNVMTDMAQGKYVAFVDDDDRIEDNYLSELLAVTHLDFDVITFLVSVTINGGRAMLARYSKDYGSDHNTSHEYRRIPNHICCVKRELMTKVSFPNILKGEDSGYSKLLLPLLKSEICINKVLYHYDYNDATTETQMQIDNKPIIRNEKPVIDIVFLSNASTPQLRRMTQTAIDTCIKGANGLAVNIVVMEQNHAVNYDGVTVHWKSTPFQYNAFANQGAKSGDADWIMVANNDLIFHDAWLHRLLSAGHPLVSPKCPRDPRQRDITENTIGDTNGRHFSGWAYAIKRDLWYKIGGFDEDFTGWFADDSVIEQCKKVGVLPMLVPDSVVHHLGSTTLRRLPKEEMEAMTWGQVDKFNRKYGNNKFEDNPEYLKWKAKNVSVLE